MRAALLILLITIALGAIILYYPVGGSIWSADQVTGLALGAGDNRRVLHPSHLPAAVREALASVKADRVRRWIPGARCKSADLSFQTADGWVDVHLYCSSGFLFDHIPRDAWG